jgi:hypothetical protein
LGKLTGVFKTQDWSEIAINVEWFTLLGRPWFLVLFFSVICEGDIDQLCTGCYILDSGRFICHDWVLGLLPLYRLSSIQRGGDSVEELSTVTQYKLPSQSALN